MDYWCMCALDEIPPSSMPCLARTSSAPCRLAHLPAKRTTERSTYCSSPSGDPLRTKSRLDFGGLVVASCHVYPINTTTPNRIHPINIHAPVVGQQCRQTLRPRDGLRCQRPRAAAAAAAPFLLLVLQPVDQLRDGLPDDFPAQALAVLGLLWGVGWGQ